jgi:CIC family chloride channel protein
VVEQNKLAGRVTLLALHRIAETERRAVKVKDIMSSEWNFAYPDEDLFTIMRRFAAKDVGNLPVVTREKPEQPIGLVTRSGLWAALETAKEMRAGRIATKEMESQTYGQRLGD